MRRGNTGFRQHLGRILVALDHVQRNDGVRPRDLARLLGCGIATVHRYRSDMRALGVRLEWNSRRQEYRIADWGALAPAGVRLIAGEKRHAERTGSPSAGAVNADRLDRRRERKR